MENQTQWTPHPNLRGCFVGSGSEGLQQPEIWEKIIELTGKQPSDVNILYVGTATYDLQGPKENQTRLFAEKGCKISELKCTKDIPEDIVNLVESADAIIISGGNSLFACDRWNKIGAAPLLKAAMERGTVMTGGSAGAICWFDAGHSDSADPDTFLLAMTGEGQDEASEAPQEGESVKEWKYIRVPMLGLLPGLVCPHHDRVQSNGILRATDFDEMLKRHSGERGICIDHFAALVVQSDQFSVISLEGRPGSVLGSEFSADRQGVPGIWQKDIVEGQVVSKLVPDSGNLVNLFKVAESIEQDPLVEACRAANPDTN